MGKQNKNKIDQRRVDIIDYFLSYIFILIFFLILLIFELIQRLAFLISPKCHETVVCYLNYCLFYSLKIINIKIDVKNNSLNSFADKPIIVISNHQSLYDVPLLYVLFAKKFPRYIAKKELGKWIPSVSFNLCYGGSAVIDRSNARQAIPEIKKLAERMNKDKFAVIIFPEGTRARDGELKPFHHAGLSALIKYCGEAVIVPVALDNSWKLALNKFGPIASGLTIKFSILEPIKRDSKKEKDIIEEAHTKIAEELDKMR